MQYCEYCGTKAPEENRYCQKCGKPIYREIVPSEERTVTKRCRTYVYSALIIILSVIYWLVEGALLTQYGLESENIFKWYVFPRIVVLVVSIICGAVWSYNLKRIKDNKKIMRSIKKGEFLLITVSVAVACVCVFINIVNYNIYYSVFGNFYFSALPAFMVLHISGFIMTDNGHFKFVAACQMGCFALRVILALVLHNVSGVSGISAATVLAPMIPAIIVLVYTLKGVSKDKYIK